MGSPQQTSTPIHSPAIARYQPPAPADRKDKPLKVVLMNCQSVVKKSAEIHSLLLSINPDIVIGTESWLKPEIHSSEIFPPEYITYRRDRTDTTGGGVFILVASHLISCELDEFQSPDSEALWVQIEQKGSTNMTVGGFYRPPKTDREYLESFNSTVNRVCSNNSSNILIGGDFNLPNIDWDTYTHRQGTDQAGLSQRFLEMLDDNGLSQVVDKPTRGNNILDLMLTNCPPQINKTEVMPPPLRNSRPQCSIF